MKEMSVGEIARNLVELTREYSHLYFKHVDGEKIDKQIWAALHCGYLTALEIQGYKESMLNTALALAQNQLLQDYPKHESI